jgi:hypothetical protein
MRKIFYSVFTIFLLASSAAYAVNGGYAGGQFGFSNTDIPGSYGGQSYSDINPFVTVNLGYKVSNFFGFEMDAGRYGSISTLASNGLAVNDAGFWEVGASLNLIYPLFNIRNGYWTGVSFYLKPGVAYMYKSVGSSTNLDAYNFYLAPKVAAGLEFSTIENWSITLQYMRVFGTGNLTSPSAIFENSIENNGYLPSFNAFTIGFNYYFSALPQYNHYYY